MILATRVALFLGVAAGLSAQTLSFGEIYQTSPQTNPPTYTVDIILTTGGTAAGAQFDLNYPAGLNVTVAAGAQATTAGAMVTTTPLPATYNPFCVSNYQAAVCPQPPPQQSPNNGNGIRVIVIGCCNAAQLSTPPTAQPTANAIPDGVLATVTVVAPATPNITNEVLTIPSIYLGATTPGTNTVAAASIPLTIAGPNDGGTPANGQVNLFNTYMVGSLTPHTSTNFAPNFGSGSLHIVDTLTELFYQTGAPGYTLPLTCDDYFDAMDSSPVDTATTRGGDGHITIADTLTNLFRQTGAPGYNTLPMRTPRGLQCASSATTTAERSDSASRGPRHAHSGTH